MLLDMITALDEGQRSARGWRTRDLPAGARLFEQDARADSLHVVEQGTVELFVDGVLVDEIGPGGALGEASVWMPGERRLGSAVARTPVRVHVLGGAGLRRLRDGDGEVWDGLLEAALQQTWARLSDIGRELVAIGGAALAPVRRPTAFQRITDRLARPGEPPVAEVVLSRVPGLTWAGPDLRREVAEALESLHVPAGRALVVQGDRDDDRIWFVAQGELSVQREGARGVEELGRLGPGSLLGAAAFLGESARTASAVSTRSTWVFGLSAARARQLPPGARRAVREAVLFTMRQQLRGANRALAAARRSGGDFEQLMRVAGQLQGWRAGDPRSDVRLETLGRPAPPPALDDDTEALLARIRRGVIGRDTALATPFGLRRIVYADYTASGRCLDFVEDFLRAQVMPLYANTHTEASASGLQTTRFREEAREAVARSLNAGPDDTVIFVGSGATGAINRLIDLLGLRLPQGGGRRRAPADRPVVFVGPYEHHSNLLPWRHCDVDLVMIPLDDAGRIDRAVLVEQLEQHTDRPLRIGSFSAASNVTGVATDVDAIAELLHAHDALSFWDYAAAGPYVPIDLNPADRPRAWKDAVFLSPHKFIGGPGTPGVLALKSRLARSAVPTQPGGGTVDFVTGSDSLYSDSLTHREEAGTPAIIESIRCGLVFQLKDRVGAARIHAREQALVQAAIDAWGRNPAIEILGPPEGERLSIVSFMVRHGRGYLHYNYVVALLNDLFGIQARGGCSCAGPYGGMLLGLDEAAGDAFLRLVGAGEACLKPGWARVNFNYFIDPEEHAFVVQAVHLVAALGYALLPWYELDAASGLWTHRDGSPYRPTRLAELRLEGGEVHAPPPPARIEAADHAGVLAEARRILEAAVATRPGAARPIPEARPLSTEAEGWRWFPLPHEVSDYLSQRSAAAAAQAFTPPVTR